MKMLVHRVAHSAALPFSLSDLKQYLRVIHDDEDPGISLIGAAAAAEIEKFSQMALINQTVRVTIFDPVSGECGLSLPVGPVADDAAVAVTIDGEAFTDFELCGGNRPYIRWIASWFDLRPKRLTIEYTAGFGADETSIPRDMAQAIMDQAALIFDGRSPMDGRGPTLSPHFARIGARYRGVSL